MTENVSDNVETLLTTCRSTDVFKESISAFVTSTSNLDLANISLSSEFMVTNSSTDSDLFTTSLDNHYTYEDVVNMFQLVFTAVITLCGCVGNALVIFAVFTHRRLRHIGNAFVVNLAVVDLCVSAFINAFAIAGLVTKGAFFKDRDSLCQAIGVICVTR